VVEIIKRATADATEEDPEAAAEENQTGE
jgi:hypothetical protein